MQILIEIQYLPPIQYFSKFFDYEKLIIDDTGVFEKQSYRNRCRIAAANGILSLSVPVKNARARQQIRDVEIDNSRNWQREHWHSIKSAYGKSPFFEHYAHYFQPFYEQEHTRLFELDFALLNQCMKALKIPENKIVLKSDAGDEFESLIPNIFDFRDGIHPKEKLAKEDKNFIAKPYLQVFEERYGFIPNLSIIDLIFNEGPRSGEVVKW